MASKEAILSADAAVRQPLQAWPRASSISNIRSVMCAPLITSQGEVMGVIQIDTADQRNRFNRDDLDLLASVACQAAIAVENADLHEMAIRAAGAGPRVGRRPRRAAGLPAGRAAADRGLRFLPFLRTGQRARRRLLRLHSAWPAGGWRWSWRTCRAKAFPPRC